MMGPWWHKGRKWLAGRQHCCRRSTRSTFTSRPLEIGALAMAPSSSLAAAGGAHQASQQATSRLVSLPLATSALSLAPDTSLAAAGEPPEASTEATALVSLPIEILTLIHSSLLWTDGSVRSCIALEATSTELRSVLHSNTRYGICSVESGCMATATQDDSFRRWMASNGRRIDQLQLQMELRHCTPQLCSFAGVLQAGKVAVTATVVDTLEPLRGLVNLTALVKIGRCKSDCRVSLQPLARLPALQHVDLLLCISPVHTNLAALNSLQKLRALRLEDTFVPYAHRLHSLKQLRHLSPSVRELHLLGFDSIRSLAPLSRLTALACMVLDGFADSDGEGILQPLHALAGLKSLTLRIGGGDHPISLQPLCQLASLTWLRLKGNRDQSFDYDLQPLPALARTLRGLVLEHCVLPNLSILGPLRTALRLLALESGIEQQLASLQLDPMSIPLPHLTSLSISTANAADLDAVGQQLLCLKEFTIQYGTDSVTSLAALASLTRLSYLDLESIRHISSIEPLTTLTGLQHLLLGDCVQLTSLTPLTALQALRMLWLHGCHRLAAPPLVPSACTVHTIGCTIGGVQASGVKDAGQPDC
jgi:hypothetical protein